MAKLPLSDLCWKDLPTTGITAVVSRFKASRAYLTQSLVAQLRQRCDSVWFCGEPNIYLKRTTAMKHCPDITALIDAVAKDDAKQHLVVIDGPHHINDQHFVNWIDEVGALAIVMVRNIVDISPFLRSNLSVCFISKEPTLRQQRRLFNAFHPMFASLNQFKQLLKRCTGETCAMALRLDMATDESEVSDYVFRYYRTWYTTPLWEPKQAFKFLIGLSPTWEKRVHLLEQAYNNWVRMGGRTIHAKMNTVTGLLYISERHARITWEDDTDDVLQCGDGVIDQLSKDHQKDRLKDCEIRQKEYRRNPSFHRLHVADEEIEFDGHTIAIRRHGTCPETWFDQELLVTRAGIEYASISAWDNGNFSAISCDLNMSWFRDQVKRLVLRQRRRRKERRVAHWWLDDKIAAVLVSLIVSFI